MVLKLTCIDFILKLFKRMSIHSTRKTISKAEKYVHWLTDIIIILAFCNYFMD